MLEVSKKVLTDFSKGVVFAYKDSQIDYSIYCDKNRDYAKKILDDRFKGESGERVSLDIIVDGNLLTLYYVGLGEKEKAREDVVRTSIYKGLKGLDGDLFITVNKGVEVDENILEEVSFYLNYTFDKYRTTLKDDEKKTLNLHLDGSVFKKTTGEGRSLAEGVILARDLVNEPANVMYPEALANEAKKLGDKYGFEVEVYEEDKIEDLGMKAYLSVARAAHRRPRLIVMRYNGDPSNTRKYGLIGKGLTYDTGGLSLKPTSSMLDMKSDMGGAGTVIGALCVMASEKVEKNLVVVVAACENSIGGNAYRPGDIIGSMNGKSIEVNNTDAEGRLTLADAITYAIREEKVDEVVDVATLTGAAVVALGEEVTAAFTHEDETYKLIEDESKKYGELIWRMPLFDFYKDSLKSSVADLVNTGSRWGGASSAAKFVEEFTEGLPWMHLDIAATSFYSKGKGYHPKGGTGQVVRALYGYYKNK